MLIAILASFLIGIALFWYIPDCREQPLSSIPESISIIIPARNEERNIGQLLRSIRKQQGDIEVIVADDHSTDETAAMSRRLGAKIVSLPPLPEGWLGKSWGCWNGAHKARGDVLLFLDADTVLEKNGLAKLLSCYYKQEPTLLSVHPYHETKRSYESLSALFHSIVLASMNAFHLFQDYTKPSGIFGQCLLCRRDDYFRFGGHEGQKGELLEMMSFGRFVLKQGGTVRCVSGRGAVSMRMYPSGFLSLVEGWSKSFAKGAASTNIWSLLLIVLWVNGIMTLTVQLFAPSVLTIVLYILFALQLFWIGRRIGRFGLGSALLFPVHALVFLAVFVLSFVNTMLRRRVLWKGRTIEMKKE